MKVGMMLPQSPSDGDGGSWPEIERLARMADEGGADSVWVCDHFLYRGEGDEEGYHEPFTLLTAVGAITTRVEMGPLVAATSYRPVGMLAKIAATLDSVARGRLILGLGCGWHEPEYRAFDYPFDHRVGRFEEQLQALRPLLDGERVTMTGTWTRLDDAVILPRPERRIPIVVASEGPRMMALTARHADAWQCGWSGLPDDAFRRELASLEAACAAEGRTDRIGLFKGVQANDDKDDTDPHLPLEAGAIADGLAAWEAEGIDHVQLQVLPMTQSTFEIGLEGIRRFRG
jgi:alkanesulfonate monooxygenase SsuD/methylene tetrahydromethanopterin reductase-like flavin-dependent oxidoreductase (luciferase family)